MLGMAGAEAHVAIGFGFDVAICDRAASHYGL